MESSDVVATTHSLGEVVRATGLSAELLRAWERRYGAIEPMRSPGGTRRYRDSDVARLRLLKSAVDAGRRISEVAGLSDDELIRGVAEQRGGLPGQLGPAFEAIRDVDAAALRRIAEAELARLGAPVFVQEFALPLLQRVGDGWAAQQCSIAGEHLASSLLRSMLGTALLTPNADANAPHVVFATPEGEHHELGTLSAAVVGVSLGLRATYLGADLPAADLARTVSDTRAQALAMGIAHQRAERTQRFLAELDERLAPGVEIWIGGPRCRDLAGGRTHAIPSFEALEHRVGSLRVGP